MVAAYVPEYRAGIDWDYVARRATDLVLFSVEPLPDGDIKAYFPIDDEGDDSAMVKAQAARKATRGAAHLPVASADGGVRLLLCVGGAGRSENFAAVAASPKLRLVFISNLLALVEKHGLQGVDFDWEIPMRRSEVADYGRLLMAASAAFRARNLIITATVHPHQDLGQATYGFLDRVHLMSYDGRHVSGHSPYQEAIADAKRLASYNCPMDKIALGLPFYGRGVTNPGLVLTYADLVKKVGADLDPTSDVLGKDSAIGFNNVLTVQKKTKWALRHGLAGVMIWEAGQDTTDPATSLMEAISDAKMGIKKPGRFKKKSARTDPRFRKVQEKAEDAKKNPGKKRQTQKKRKRRNRRSFDL